ncbi:hypothetical protein FMUND_15530 [Fusarium mundagurra]|uniref:Uncharacterized protein n=1 Tax=Fusarium mundagurra TaxID=1567541 RepID=A0A8H5XP46_9HYPO|nr:hypothetical protein FMUND_15530 [Fusarium mundagurra]
MKTNREMLSTAATVAMYLFRVLQIGSGVIAGFVGCYLAWEHTHHYCNWYSCSDKEQQNTSVPIGEVLFITASVLVSLEWMFFGGSLAFQTRTGKPALVNPFTQFIFSCLVLIVYSIGFVAFASISTVHATWPYCFNTQYTSVFGPPEKRFCIVTQTGVTCGLITWITCLVVALLSLVEIKKEGVYGRIRLENDTVLPVEDDAVSIRDVAVNSPQ